MIMLVKKNIKACCRQCDLLLAEIETIRELLILTALKKGFTDPQSVEISQNLDQLLTRLNQLSRRGH